MTTLYRAGDGIKGYKIVCRARRIGKPQLIHMTSKDKGTQLTITNNASAYIETAFQTARRASSTSER